MTGKISEIPPLILFPSEVFSIHSNFHFSWNVMIYWDKKNEHILQMLKIISFTQDNYNELRSASAKQLIF